MPGPTEQTLTWYATLQDELSGKLQHLQETSQDAWTRITASFGEGATAATVAEQAIGEGLTRTQSVLRNFAIAAAQSGSTLQLGLVQTLQELMTRVEAFRRAEMPLTAIEEMVDAFARARSGTADLGRRFKQLAEESPELFAGITAELQRVMSAVFGTAIPDSIAEAVQKGVAAVDTSALIGITTARPTAGPPMGDLQSSLNRLNETLKGLQSAFEGGLGVKGLDVESIVALLGGAMTAATTGASLRDLIGGALARLKDQMKKSGTEVGEAAGEAFEGKVEKVARQLREGREPSPPTPGEVISRMEEDFARRQARQQFNIVTRAIMGAVEGLVAVVPRAFRLLGEKVFAGLKVTVLSFGAVASRVGQSIARTARAVLGAISPIALLEAAVRRVLAPVIEMAMDLFDALIAPLEGLSAQLSMVLIPVFEILQSALAPVIRLVELLLPIVMDFVERLLAPVLVFVQAMEEPMMMMVEAIAEFVRALEPILDIVIMLVRLVLDIIRPVLLPVIKAVTFVIRALAEAMKAVLTPIIRVLTTLGLIKEEPAYLTAMERAAIEEERRTLERAAATATGVAYEKPEERVFPWLIPSLRLLEEAWRALPRPYERLEPVPYKRPEPVSPLGPPVIVDTPEGPVKLYPVPMGKPEEWQPLTKEDQEEISERDSDKIVVAIQEAAVEPDDWAGVSPEVARLASFPTREVG